MSTLRDVSLELARMEREMKKKEEEYNKQKSKTFGSEFFKCNGEQPRIL